MGQFPSDRNTRANTSIIAELRPTSDAHRTTGCTRTEVVLLSPCTKELG